MSVHDIRHRPPDAQPPISPGMSQWLQLAGLPIRATYTAPEVAQLLHIELREVYRLIQTGRLSRLEVPETGAGKSGGVRPTRIPYAAIARLLPAHLR